MITFKCSHCGEPMESPDSLAGQYLDCPKCKKYSTVPKPENIKVEVVKRGLIKAWQSSPPAFRNGFLCTLGGVMAILLALYTHSHLFSDGVSPIEKTTLRMQSLKLFPVGTPLKTIFRGRLLTEHTFCPDANVTTISMSAFVDDMGNVVGYSATWFGTRYGNGVDLALDDKYYYANIKVEEAVNEIFDESSYVITATIDFEKQHDAEYDADEFFRKKGNKNYFLLREKSILELSDIYKKIYKNDPTAYRYFATLTLWQ